MKNRIDEIQSLYDEISNNDICDEAKLAGYDNLHDYEANMNEGFVKKTVIILGILIISIFILLIV